MSTRRLDTGLIIQKMRKDAGLNQEELAEKLSSLGYRYASSTIATWETGRSLPPLNEPAFIRVLATALETDVRSILSHLKIYDADEVINIDDLSPDEAALITAYRKSDFQSAMRILAEKS